MTVQRARPRVDLPQLLFPEGNAPARPRVLPPVLSVLALVLAVDAGLPQVDYDAGRVSLDTRRRALAARFAAPSARATVRAEARSALLAFVDDVAFPAWAGTPWDFYGPTTVPREGKIACGYFVSTVLEHAGFRVERVRLAQQASAYIVATMARGTPVAWLRFIEPAEVLAQVRRRFGDDGLFIVGMDLHVGYLRLTRGAASFCHASFLTPGAVTCEDPLTSPGFVSQLYVVGDALPDAAVEDWLAQRKVSTRVQPSR